MKALVVEIKDKYAVVLKKDGTFARIKNTGGLNTGYETEIPSGKTVMFPGLMKVASLAAAFLVVIGMGYGVYCYNTPYSYVSVDINPGVEITANAYDKILKVSAVNEDGREVLKGIDLTHKNLVKGLEKIVDAAIKEGYLKTRADNAMIITVASKDNKKADELEKKVQKAAVDELNDSGIDGEVLVEGTSREKQIEAQKIGITPGKLNLIKKLEDVKKDINVEEYKDASVKQIMNEIKEAVKTAKSLEKESTGKNNGKAAVTVQQETAGTSKMTGTSGATVKKGNSDRNKTSAGKSGEKGNNNNGKNTNAAAACKDKEEELTSGSTANENNSTGAINGNREKSQNKSKNKDTSWIQEKVEDILDSVGITQPDDTGNDGQQDQSKGNDNQKGNEKNKK